ncbi:MAG: hypothetical protein V4550_10275 [Gemmatimonadota bacterium]
MAYRVFTDSRGTEWQTWDVVPRFEERRLAERRTVARQLAHTDKRSNERRVLSGQRSVLSSGLRSGWLCFEAPGEKRRLTPIPGDWHRCRVDQLEEYCASATPARPTIRALSPIDVN